MTLVTCGKGDLGLTSAWEPGCVVINAESEQRNTLEDVSRPNPARKAVALLRRVWRLCVRNQKVVGSVTWSQSQCFSFPSGRKERKKETLSLYEFYISKTSG